jgi:hypothetical protein
MSTKDEEMMFSNEEKEKQPLPIVHFATRKGTKQGVNGSYDDRTHLIGFMTELSELMVTYQCEIACRAMHHDTSDGRTTMGMDICKVEVDGRGIHGSNGSYVELGSGFFPLRPREVRMSAEGIQEALTRLLLGVDISNDDS